MKLNNINLIKSELLVHVKDLALNSNLTLDELSDYISLPQEQNYRYNGRAY